MEDTLNKGINVVSDMIRLFSLLLIGFVTIGVGCMLLVGGRYEGLVPGLIGVMSLWQVPGLIKTIYLDFTGNY